MRLEITRKADLATRALVLLARTGERRKAGELAQTLAASPAFLNQAMRPLVARGWVRSEPGPTGGYLLESDLRDISVLEVIESVEGPTDVERCVLQQRPCGSTGNCALHDPWTAARSQLVKELARTPMQTLVDRPADGIEPATKGL